MTIPILWLTCVILLVFLLGHALSSWAWRYHAKINKPMHSGDKIYIIKQVPEHEIIEWQTSLMVHPKEPLPNPKNFFKGNSDE